MLLNEITFLTYKSGLGTKYLISYLGVIHKPSGRGKGFLLIFHITALHWSTKGEWSQKCTKNCPHGLVYR